MNKDMVLIGERVLQRPDGGQDVTVKMFMPETDEHGGFRCHYQICGIGNEALRFGSGLDGIHAIQMTLMKIGVDLFVRHKNVKLVFSDIDDPGFPQPVLKE